MNRLYLACDGDRPVWVAVERDGLLYVYSPDTGAFHLSRPVTVDFFSEGELTYRPLSVEAAREEIAAGVGKLDKRSMGDVVEEFRSDSQPLSADAVLGEDTVTVTETRSVRAQALAQRLNEAPAGEWITWQVYPVDQRQRAYVAASDLRAGRVKTVTRTAGAVEATVTRAADGSYAVLVARHDPESVD